MRKYLAIAKIKILDSFEYRTEVVLWQIIEIIPIITMSTIWIALAKDQIGKYSTPQLVTYYFLSLIIGRLVNYHFSDYQATYIKNGRFSLYLIRPLSFIKSTFSGSISSKLTLFLITSVPIILIITLFFYSYLLPPLMVNLPLFVITIILANLISFLLQMLIVCAAFYLKTIEGIKHAHWMATSILGGAMIPLTFLPQWLQTISNILPFKLLFFIPISIYMGRITMSEILSNIIQAIIWIAILFLLYKWSWKKGLKKYSAVSG